MSTSSAVASTEEVFQSAERTKTTKSAIIAMVCVLLYEWMITLDMEIEYIWRAPGPKLTLTNALFSINRYYPLVRATFYAFFTFNRPTSARLCRIGTDFNSWSTVINVGVVEVLMLLRAWAVWNRSKTVGFTLATVFTIAFIASVVIINSRIPPILGIIQLPPRNILPCDRPSTHKYVLEYCIALFVEAFSFGFMFSRVFSMRSRKSIGRRGAPLLFALWEQGAYYFLPVLSVMSFAVISGFVEQLTRPVLHSGLAPTITSIACNRVLLALRGVFLSNSTIAGTPGEASITAEEKTGNTFSGGKEGKLRSHPRRRPSPLKLPVGQESGTTTSRGGPNSVGDYLTQLSGVSFQIGASTYGMTSLTGPSPSTGGSAGMFGSKPSPTTPGRVTGSPEATSAGPISSVERGSVWRSLSTGWRNGSRPQHGGAVREDIEMGSVPELVEPSEQRTPGYASHDRTLGHARV